MQKENQLESCLTSPLAGEDARRAGEGDMKGMPHFSPSSVCSDFVRQTTSPAQGGSHTTNGFTLIELLVVVLIIGILAAVALPQYQKAVEKSRAAAIFPLLKAIGEAQENYYLANGTYATSFDDLTVDIPFTGTEKWGTHADFTDTRSNNDWSIQLYPGVNAVSAGRLTGPYAGAGFAYFYGDWVCPPAESGMGVCAHTLTCTIKKDAGAGGVDPGSNRDQYCSKIFKTTRAVQSGPKAMFYALP